MLTRMEGSKYIAMPNFLETGLSNVEMLRFFDFPNAAAMLDF